MLELKPIDGDINNGYEYDYKLINKEFRKLHIPKYVYNPLKDPIEDVSYIFNLSERKTGKTTNWLLYGMVMHELYGVQIQYLRDNEANIQPKAIRDLFNVILAHDYISKVTHGRWKGCTYYASKWYYCNYDDAGKICEQDPESFCNCLALSKWADYKSIYNAPRGDLIIFDEFIGKYYPRDEFLSLMDVHSTIVRSRQSAKVIMLANAIDRNSPYFEEFNIRKDIQKLQPDQYKYIITDLGTPIFIRFISGVKTKQTDAHNKRYYGFNNPKLQAITGGGWAFKQYPHLKREEEKDIEVIRNNIYIKHNNELLRCSLAYSDNLGYFVKVMRGKAPQDDAIIYTSDIPLSASEKYGLGWTDGDKKFWTLYNRRRWYFATNEVGDIVDSFVTTIHKDFRL